MLPVPAGAAKLAPAYSDVYDAGNANFHIRGALPYPNYQLSTNRDRPLRRWPIQGARRIVNTRLESYPRGTIFLPTGATIDGDWEI